MNLEELSRASCYEELELLLTLQALQGKRKKVFSAIANYQDGIFFCIPTKVGFVWYSKNSLKRIEAPEKVGGDFNCSFCASLTSLEGAPQEVDGGFWCNNCASLTSLEGAPKEINGDFDCAECVSLTSLRGAPEKVGRNFWCTNCSSLTSLKGAPQEIGGDFYCYKCSSLTSLEIKRLKKSISYKIISSFNRF